jgi:UDP-N-acetylmuramoylalanine--D-glutamate ligase
MNMDALAGKKVVILGLARQGTALARFAVRAGATVVVSDLRPPEKLQANLQALSDLDNKRLTFVVGEHPLRLLEGADLLAISGGVAADAPLVLAARARGIPITNDSLEFMKRTPATVIGITGSAGKTTTTALTGQMARLSGRPTWVGGNIGHPLIADLEQMKAGDLVVEELSSFQLELWNGYSPPIAAVLNVTPNHLDRHRTIADYTHAKSNILRFQDQNGIAVLSADDPGAAALRWLVRGRLRFFSLEQAVTDGAYTADGFIWLNNGAGRTRKLCPSDTIQLRGRHNTLNVLAAVTLADAAGIPDEAMVEAIQTFQGVPHRLELVGMVNGVQYINDSIATAPERSLAALAAFREPVILLAGGRDKNMIWDEWARQVRRRASHVILFGELGSQLQAHLNGNGAVTRVGTLDDAVATAARLAVPGDVVLLSPGGTSFDAFEDFAARGDCFRRLVERLGPRD